MATHSSILAWNSVDRGAWQATVHGAAESDTTERLTLSLIITTIKVTMPRCLMSGYLGHLVYSNEVDTVSHRGHMGRLPREVRVGIGRDETEVKTFSSVQFSSVTQSCPTLCDSMNHSTPGLPVHHHLPEFTQTHVHRVGDTIKPSHPLSSPSPPAPNPSQHQSLFQ